MLRLSLLVLLSSAWSQQSGEGLRLGEVLEGRLTEKAATVRTPDPETKVVGQEYPLEVKASGVYRIRLRSYEFDAYLALKDAHGKWLIHSDNGWVGKQARVTAELRAGERYRVLVAAHRDGRGAFQLELLAGEPEPLSPSEQIQSDEQDHARRIEHLQSIGAKDDVRMAYALKNMGDHFFRLAQYEQARDQFQLALSAFENSLGSQHLEVARVLEMLSGAMSKLQEWDAALLHTEQALGIRERQLGPDHFLTGFSLYNLSKLYMRLGRLEDALPLAERSLGIQERTKGPNHRDTAQGCQQLAGLLAKLGQMDEARTLYERALAIHRRVSGENHKDTAKALIAYFRLLRQMGAVEQAESVGQQAIAACERVFGADHDETAVAIHEFGLVFAHQGDWSRAEPHFERAYRIHREALGESDLYTSDLLHALSKTRYALHRYEQALEGFEKVLKTRRTHFGDRHVEVASVMNDIVTCFSALGDNERARPFAEMGLEIVLEVHGAEHPVASFAMTNLAHILFEQGQYEEARELGERALAIQEGLLGRDSLDVALTLNDLASVAEAQQRFDAARELYERCLGIFEQQQAMDLPQAISSLSNYGGFLDDRGLHGEAREAFERALALWEQYDGHEHPNVTAGLNNLALSMQADGEFELAKETFDRALAQSTKMRGKLHPITTQIIRNQAELQREVGDHLRARDLSEQVVRNCLAYLDNELPSMSEAGRIRLLQVTANPGFYLASVLEAEPEELSSALHLCLQWKGKATRMQSAGLRLRQLEQSSVFRRQQQDIQALTAQLSDLLFTPQEYRGGDYETELASLRAKRLRLERELNGALELGDTMELPDLETIRQGIPENAVVIDFYVGAEVFAWIFGAKGAPKLISLGTAASVRRAMSAFLQGLAPRTTDTRGGAALSARVKRDANALYPLLWQPLQEAMPSADQVLICPDGFLGELPFGALRDADGEYLIEQHRFRYVSDASRIQGRQSREATAEGALLIVGDVDYSRRGEHSKGEWHTASTRARVDGEWHPLSGTRVEIDTVKSLYSQLNRKEDSVQLLKREQATEERVRTEIPGHEYLHFATHGYFEPEHLPSLLGADQAESGTARLGQATRAAGLLPGLLSGLVLAGVNGEPDPERDDGYLSAEEIQHIDLTGCELAVLSACETALGSARSGEGLMSLRRAFEVAGTQTVISSLWRVDDQATARLMKWFYENHWVLGMDKGEALHQAKLRMLRENRSERDGEARPETWGAFVLSGSWR